MKKSFREIVEDELNNRATPEEIEFLEDQPETWRVELVSMRRELDADLSKAKADFLQKRRSLNSAEFLQIKADFQFATNELNKRQVRTKALKKEMQKLAEEDFKNQADAEVYIDEEMLAELKAITKLLERVCTHFKIN